MNKTIFFLLISIFLLVSSNAHAFWIWTPQTKRWINPKYSPKENAKLQLEEVEGLYNAKKFALALREARKLVSYFPKAVEAAEGQYYIALCLEKMEKYFQAYKEYQLTIEKYPFSKRIMEIIKREYEIGDMYLEGKLKQTLGNTLSGDEPAIEIFTNVLDNAPYSEFAAASQYKLGLALLRAKRLYEAKDAFNKVLENYPESEWVEPAKYQIGVVSAELSVGLDYDRTSTASARKQFEDFIKTYPDAQLSQEAKGKISQLKEEEAEANFKTAIFYEKQKAKNSARIYYQYVIDNYPNSEWARKAKEKLSALEVKK
ncbi:MAG: outer membrane protein assembly factor BamD [Candidatus Omnitrophota bacterium]